MKMIKKIIIFIFWFNFNNSNSIDTKDILDSSQNKLVSTKTGLNSSNKNKFNQEEKTQYLSATILIIWFVMMCNNFLLTGINYIKEKYPKKFFWIQKSAISIILGIIIGFSLYCFSAYPIVNTIKSSFQNVFMIIILPPILFESTLNMNRKRFFINIGTISIFSFIGTFIAIFVTAFLMYYLSVLNILNNYSFIDCLIFGCLISATDPVSVWSTFKEIKANKDLYSLIFGESILNDAITLVFYKSVIFYYNNVKNLSYFNLFLEFFIMIISSILLGLACGIFGSIIVKIINQSKIVDSNYALTVLLIVPWISYLLAESIELSGIVTIMFCGITLSSYSLPLLNKNNNDSIKNIYLILAENFENLAFILIGISLFTFTSRVKELGFISFFVVLLILLIARYCNIYFLSFIINKFKKKKIPKNFQFILWFSGLRGAMAFSLALMNYYNLKSNVGKEFLTLTIILTIFSIKFFGIFWEPLIKKFEVDNNLEVEKPSFLQVKYLEVEKKYFRKYFRKKIDSIKDIDIERPNLFKENKIEQENLNIEKNLENSQIEDTIENNILENNSIENN